MLKKDKEKHELEYWTKRKKKDGLVDINNYEYFYTVYFGLDKEFYKGKKILDIGCGPRGSLEWADMAAERIGLDPLVDEYRKLGIDKHKMRYISAGAENIPFPDGYFDVVCSFNSLDHVDDLDKAIKEIIRVLAPNGYLLLITDVNHVPSPTEPLTFSWDIVQRFLPQLKILEEKHHIKGSYGVYQSVKDGVPYKDESNKKEGTLTVKFIK